MNDLKVDYYQLEDSFSTMRRLTSAFDGIEDRNDDTKDIWGHDGVRDAMDEFSGNMDYNREKLSEKLKEVGAKIENTLETFRDADAELAKSLDEQREG